MVRRDARDGREEETGRERSWAERDGKEEEKENRCKGKVKSRKCERHRKKEMNIGGQQRKYR